MMKRFRKHPLFLLAIALALPLGVAFLHYQFYDENDLVVGKYFSKAQEFDLSSFLRKNPRVFVSADEPLQSAGINLFETKSFHYIHPASSRQTSPVLRC
jgi:hypothetical protein